MSEQPISGTSSHSPGQVPVTVIIRTRNRPDFLRRAIRSVCEQDYAAIEVLVINDGSEDLSPLVEEFSGSLQALKIVKASAPGGRVAAANTGLQEASGDYLIFLDDDDWFYADHVSKLVAALDSNPAYGLAYTGIECKREQADSGELITEHVFNQAFDPALFLIRNFIPMHAAMFRRTLLDKQTVFDKTLDFYEDWDFWLQLHRKTGFLYVPGISACYYLSADSGFGMDQASERQLRAEQIFFAKWQRQWSVEELKNIINVAREVPRLRQDSHEAHLKMQDLYRDRAAREENFQTVCKTMEQHHQNEKAGLQHQHQHEQDTLKHQHQQEQDALIQKQEEMKALHHRELETMRAQGREQDRLYRELKTENLRIKNEFETARASLDAVLNSKSWKITRPLRQLNTVLRLGRLHVRRQLEKMPLRYANARNILSQKGSRGLLQHVRSKLLPVQEAVMPPVQEFTPFRMRVIKPEDFSQLASELVFQEVPAPVVSIIIPVYKHLELTLACLQSICQNPQESSHEVIVVDDASSDETAAVLGQCKGLIYLCNEENSGFIRTCNKGAQHARGKYLFFLNNDTEVQEQWLDPLVAVLDSHPDAGIAGAKLLYPSGHLQEAGASLRADGTVDMIGLNGNPADPRYCRLREVDHCSGAALMIRAELFREVGGFDECYAPAYFEDCDLSLKVRQAGFRILFQPESGVVHHLSVSTETLPGGKMAQIERNKSKYLERWSKVLQEADKVRLIAFFLPQFHPIPENDEWWGKGFTEWTNVTRARPLYRDHYQPHRPTELGYYDLRLPEIREQQAQLAREYGVYGFCYYHYWFNGKRLLERPVNDMLASGKPDFPFCVCWANENWTRRWDGRESEVLMAQDYKPQSNVQFIRDLLPVFADGRYIRIKGRPLLLLYRAELIPGLAEAIPEWRRITREAGLGEVYLAAVESFTGVDNELSQHFDALVEFPPHGRSVPVRLPPPGLQADFKGQMFEYAASAANFMQRTDTGPKLFRTAMPSWDNTARRQNAAHIYVNANPHHYQQWLAGIARETRNSRMGDERIVFVNAWNEWAEGNHLEPDERYGRDWLEATRNALGEMGHYPEQLFSDKPDQGK